MGITERKDGIMNAGIITAHVGPFGMHRYASEFLQAALLFKAKHKGFTPVPYYLICRSIELSLKAFLLARGVDRTFLKKKLGHDITVALHRAERECLSSVVKLRSNERDAIQQVNELYKEKKFEYFEDLGPIFGFTPMPDLILLTSFAKRLLANTEQLCIAAINGPCANLCS